MTYQILKCDEDGNLILPEGGIKFSVIARQELEEVVLGLKYVQKLLDDAYLAHTANREESKNNDDVKEEKL